MRNLKKLFALALSLVMMVSVLVPAAFADDTYTLTINNEAADHIYEAYQIFSGTLSSDGSTLSNVEWGDGVDNGSILLNALKNDIKEIALVNGDKTTLSKIFSAANNASDIATLLGTISNDSTTLDRFAEVVGEHLSNTSFTQSTRAADNKTYTISGLKAGYYLVKDQNNSQECNDDFYTKYIVRIVKSDSIQVKGSGVTSGKSINDTVDGTYNDYDDFDVNDTAYFKLEGTLPTNLRDYDYYWYKFTDTLPAGLTFLQLEAVYVQNHSGTVVHTFLDLNDSVDTNDELPTGASTTSTAADDIQFSVNNQQITLEFKDLLTLYPSLLSTDRIVVKYSCRVNRNMEIAKANTNEMTLEYSNNPNGDGYGKTVPDYAHAFTYQFTIDKYDMANRATKLENVQFRLYYRTTGQDEQIVKMYAMVVTEKLIDDGYELNETAVTTNDLGLVYGWTSDVEKASTLNTDENGAFTVKGLDEGTYFLEETATVDGYNKLDTPVQVDIIPTYSNTDKKESSVTVEYKVDSLSQGNNGVVGIRNSKGSTLPSTGGIGTTVFYVAGGAMVVAALVLLITKKRMSSEK